MDEGVWSFWDQDKCIIVRDTNEKIPQRSEFFGNKQQQCTISYTDAEQSHDISLLIAH